MTVGTFGTPREEGRRQVKPRSRVAMILLAVRTVIQFQACGHAAAFDLRLPPGKDVTAAGRRRGAAVSGGRRIARGAACLNGEQGEVVRSQMEIRRARAADRAERAMHEGARVVSRGGSNQFMARLDGLRRARRHARPASGARPYHSSTQARSQRPTRTWLELTISSHAITQVQESPSLSWLMS